MNISFALTTRQFLDRSKDVTRRLGWRRLKQGDVLTAVEKGQGLKKGEQAVILGRIRVKTVRREPLNEILRSGYGDEEVIREGFGGLSPLEFLDFFCQKNNCDRQAEVTRIEFEYL